MPQHRPRRGFTLTELLVAIGIIVILIGLLLPVVTRVRKAAYGASTQNQISVLSSAIEQYHNDFNAYPGPLPLNQIDYTDANATNSTAGAAIQPVTYDNTGAAYNLVISPTAPTSTAGTFNANLISGPENLVLGLLGGLKFFNNAGTITFEYDPTVIFTVSGSNLSSTPAAAGPSSLNLNTPKVTPAYITVKTGDISNPFDSNAAKANASFADAAGRASHDTIIPVFMDKYPDAMPILYMRAQRAAAGLVSFAGYDKPSGNSLASDTASGQTITSWQYDLREIYAYTNSDGTMSTPDIGVNVSKTYSYQGSPKVFVHGLQKVWDSTNSPATYQISSSAPVDAWAYLRNPSLGPALPSSGTPSDIGTPRQKDGYILISAGPDRLYGTTDDITSFGSVSP